jgi:hypothetical protein
VFWLGGEAKRKSGTSEHHDGFANEEAEELIQSLYFWVY